MALADAARGCIPSPSLVRELASDDASSPPSPSDTLTAFARVSERNFATLRQRATDLEPARGLITPRPVTPRARKLVEVIEDDGNTSEVTSTSESALALLACAAHGAWRDGDVPRWSNERLSALAAEVYDDGLKARDAVVRSFIEACECDVLEALRAPKDSFGMNAELDSARARVAARQLSWCLERKELMESGGVPDVMTRVMEVALPCVLRALDYPLGDVRTNGARCARAMSRVAGLGWQAASGAVLLDACRSALIGASAEVWPHALDAACVLTYAVVSGGGSQDVVEEYRKTFTRAIDCACLHGMEVAYAAPLLASFPDLIQHAKACIVVHLDRLLPLLCGYMQSYKDDVAISAATLIALVVKNAWPRVHAHCESMWPHMKRAYAEADGRSAANCDKLRAELESVAEIVQLAAGENFTRVWENDKDIPSHAAGLTRYLAALPARTEGDRSSAHS